MVNYFGKMLKFQFLLGSQSCLTLLFSFCCFCFVHGQTAPGIQWQNTIGGSNGESLHSIQQTADGGYILGGNSNSDISGDKTENCIGNPDYWIVKTDSTGIIQWQNTIGGSGPELFRFIQQTNDGGYILGGYSFSDISGDKTENCLGHWDYWIVKIDSTGNLQWENTIGGNQWDHLYSINQTADGGYILCGFSLSNISGDKTENSNGKDDCWIVKTDSAGNIQWQNTIGGSDDDRFFASQQTNDGGYIFGGFSRSNISGDKTENSNGNDDCWIVKTDSAGNIQWQNTIGGSGNDYFYSVQQTTDGGYILCGSSSSNISGDKTENSNGFTDYWIVKTDSVGNIQWQNTIGGSDNEVSFSAQQTSDNGFIMGGWSRSNITGDKTENNWDTICNSICTEDYWIVKTDSGGNIQWQNTIGGTSNDVLLSLQQTNDGGYILGGYSASSITGDKTENNIGGANDYDYWIIKLYPDTITSTPEVSGQPTPTSGLQIFPNPFTNNLAISLNNLITNNLITVFIYDVLGKQVLSQSLTTTNRKLQTVNLPAGVYFVKAISGNNVWVQKVVKE